MALETAKIPVIREQFPTSDLDNNDIFIVYKPSTGQTHGILVSEFLNGSDISNFRYSSTKDYAVDEPTVEGDKWYISLQTPNVGKLPSSNPLYWQQINKVSASSLKRWVTGLYTDNEVFTVDPNDLSLYELKPAVPRPFNSALSPSNDLTNWNPIIGGGGGGVTEKQIQDSQFIYDEDSGSANAYSITLLPDYTYHQDGQMAIFKATSTNTGASTLDSGLDDVPIVRRDGTPLKAGDIPSGSMNVIVRDGSQWQLITSTSSDDVIPFVYSITVGAMEEVSLPMDSVNDAAYSFVVDYGDGSPAQSISSYADPNRLHTYVSAGTYDVKITGKFDYIRFLNSPNSVVNIRSWGIGGIGVSSFLNCTNLTTISATDRPKMFGTSLSGCFNGSPLNIVDSAINTWDVSSVINFQQVFSNSFFNQNIGSWDVSSGTSFSSMFSSNTAFNQNIDTWDTTLSTSFANMFNGASSFNQPLNSWSVSNVTTFLQMFRNATAFNQDLDSWVTTAATDMSGMFTFCSNFNGDISNFDTLGVTNASKMLQGCTSFNQNIGGWNVSTITNFSEFLTGSTIFNQDISSWVTTAATNMFSMFFNCTAFNQDISGFDMLGVSTVGNMLRGCPSFDQDLSVWNWTTITNAQGFLTNSTLSTANYDAMLVGIEAQAVQNGVTFSGGNSTYTAAGAGGTARASLIADHSWVITDGGGI